MTYKLVYAACFIVGFMAYQPPRYHWKDLNSNNILDTQRTGK